MKVYEELIMARYELSKCDLKKSGFNLFTKHRYFELNDILPNLKVINKLRKLITVFSMNHEVATLRIIHIEDGSEVKFEMPVVMSEMKGASQIQMLGATQTYLRRYLLISAYEIIEVDVQEQQKPKIKEDSTIKTYFLELLEKAVPQEKIREIKEKLNISNFEGYDIKKLERLLDKLGVEHYKYS